VALALCTGALVTGGCGAGTGTYSVSSGGYVTSPDLAYVSPGVYVVADYNEPIFYTNNAYWRYNNGRWFSSSRYDGGWRYRTAPRALRSIDRPHAYVRYRPSTRYHARSDGRVIIRDHRDRRDHRRYDRDRRRYRR
jgi:hypothetical protein